MGYFLRYMDYSTVHLWKTNHLWIVSEVNLIKGNPPFFKDTYVGLAIKEPEELLDSRFWAWVS